MEQILSSLKSSLPPINLPTEAFSKAGGNLLTNCLKLSSACQESLQNGGKNIGSACSNADNFVVSNFMNVDINNIHNLERWGIIAIVVVAILFVVCVLMMVKIMLDLFEEVIKITAKLLVVLLFWSTVFLAWDLKFNEGNFFGIITDFALNSFSRVWHVLATGDIEGNFAAPSYFNKSKKEL